MKAVLHYKYTCLYCYNYPERIVDESEPSEVCLLISYLNVTIIVLLPKDKKVSHIKYMELGNCSEAV